MADGKRSDNVLKSSTLPSRKSKLKLNQKSILDLFPKKQKSTASITVDLDDPPAGLQQRRQESFDCRLNLDYDPPKLTGEAVDIPHTSEQTTSGSEQMVSASSLETLETLASNSMRFLTPDIQVAEHATGLREDDPIVVDSSPVKLYSQPTRAVPQTLYSIFAPRTRVEPSVTPVHSAKTPILHLEAPFPDGSSQHVRGPQTTYNAPPISFPPRYQVTTAFNTSLHVSDVIGIPSLVETKDEHAHKLRLDASTSHTVRAVHLTSIPTEHLQSHPVIAHLVETATFEPASFSGDSHRLWTDKWRPSRADHVLGNEEQATLLRQWLCALEIDSITASAPPDVNDFAASQAPGRLGKGKKKSTANEKRGTKRRVIRAVEKRKRQRIDFDDDDSWIIYSDDVSETESPPIDNFEDTEECVENASPQMYRRSRRNDSSSAIHRPKHLTFQERLTNTILLSGPNSTGKTAAVYACAAELGWEIFEVYPGVGKRSGANLDNLIGEVGKNHLVRKTQLQNENSGTNPKVEGSLRSAFARGTEKNNGKIWIPNDHRERSTSINEFGDVEELKGTQHEEHEAIARQSLILLEEVDVLFKEDVNFWGSIISLIKDCKRPVILTCNDASLVPVTELPLQDVLNFQLCSTSVATSFLQALCCAEGYLLDREVLSRFYESPHSSGLDSPRLDLRRAIHNLQLWCPENTTSAGTAICGQEIEDMLNWDWPDDHPLENKSSDASIYQVRQTYSIGSSEAYHAELVSFADCYLLRKVADMPKEMSLNEAASTATDDVLGYRILQTNGSSFRHRQFGHHDLDELIMSTIIELSRGGNSCPRSEGDSSILTSTRARIARVQYDETVKEFGHNVVAGRSQIMRRPVFDLDYLPWIRQMVAAEDSQEAMLRRDGVGVGRKTRNSQKYSRMIELSENARRGLDATVLDWS